ncbi:hypothetical protein HYH03_012362 [Edaphochlamys debaryana]|uniref:Uncharacterized protein n=1 Tax=Edaphochlamys debaryana TaxID=47281 RepID=A0A835XS78_9CHLO|nr:hypothetical protein HYH03_012362 [Edaphochlamys debaryana]|eukprot:KAG2489136.1 hypothetical protein HYH03_012362 [Edaphochlamys debaryana]
MKLKELHALMQDIAPFARPKVELEQYPTGPHLASRLLFAVDSSYDEFAGRTVVDLGCGTAMLSIGAALLGARHVVGVDVDPEALAQAADNAAQFEDEEGRPLPIDLLLADVRGLPGVLPLLRADTVIMNPPFGTKQKGVDMAFLRAAFSVSRGSVYSLHKSSTREFIAKTAKRELGASSAEVLAQLRYDLPATMKFHKQKSVDIEVDLWRFEVGEAEGEAADPQQAALRAALLGGAGAVAAAAAARPAGTAGAGRRAAASEEEEGEDKEGEEGEDEEGEAGEAVCRSAEPQATATTSKDDTKLTSTISSLDALLPAPPSPPPPPAAARASSSASASTSAPAAPRPQPAAPAPGAKSGSFADGSDLSWEQIMGFGGLAPEVINGRAAMIGFVAAFSHELGNGESVYTQFLGGGGMDALYVILLVTIASFAPAMGNPIDIVLNKPRNPRTPPREWGPFTAAAEGLNGRLAMVGLGLMIFFEGFGPSAFFMN